MDNLIRNKIILSIVDNAPISTNEIANEIGESLAEVGNQLTLLVSENICDKVSDNNVDRYSVKTDVETFSELVKVFYLGKEEGKAQLVQFTRSKYYFASIDWALLSHIINRFGLNVVYQEEVDMEEQEQILKILRLSPSALFFALHEDTAKFHESLSADNSKRMSQFLVSHLNQELGKRLFADIDSNLYNSTIGNDEIWLINIERAVTLVTINEKYLDLRTEEVFGKRKLADDVETPHFGQGITYIDPMDTANDGLAYLHLGKFQEAIERFDSAFEAVEDLNSKATILNNKGLVFLSFGHYQKAIECFEEGITFDTAGNISLIRENKQLAEEHLARTTADDNLAQPIQSRFVKGLPVPFEETRFYEFKEIIGGNAIRSINDTSDIYAVAFLNLKKGGRIFWGIRDKDRITTGVSLNEEQRDKLRVKISEKLNAIQPSIVGHWQFELHPVYDLQSANIEDLWVAELLIPTPPRKEIFYTSKGELHVKTEGGKRKLKATEVTEFIRKHFESMTDE